MVKCQAPIWLNFKVVRIVIAKLKVVNRCAIIFKYHDIVANHNRFLDIYSCALFRQIRSRSINNRIIISIRKYKLNIITLGSHTELNS
ncbi:hypothetical protein ES705_44618 [subsurface metagenome]